MTTKKMKTAQEEANTIDMRPSRREALVLFILTGVYLIVEVAFGARLLDVVSTSVDIHDVEQIEKAGRFISGAAITLLLWSMWAFKKIRRWKRYGDPHLWVRSFVILSFTSGLGLGISYVFQQGVLDYYERTSTSAQRQAATGLTLVSGSVQDELATLKGFDFNVIDVNKPETKAFMALLPALALNLDDLGDKTEEAVIELLKNKVMSEIGLPHHYYVNTYWKSMQEMERAYNKAYFGPATQHADAMNSIYSEQRKRWSEYRNRLGKYKNSRVPRRMHSRVRREVRSELSVPVNWDPDDRATFNKAVADKIKYQANGPYNNAMRLAFGEELSNDLNERTFFQDPVIQRKWRNSIGMVDAITLERRLSYKDFVRKIYVPYVKELVLIQKDLYLAEVGTFDLGQENYNAGLTAIRITYIPMVAFFFSLLGAFTHTVKTMGFAVQYLVGTGTNVQYYSVKVMKWGLFAVSLIYLMGLSNASNAVTNSELFISLENQSIAMDNNSLPTTIRTIVQLQKFMYPIAEFLRSDVLMGITFDWDPKTGTPFFEKLN